MTDVLVGLDVGTTATKAQAFGPDGCGLASASCGYGLITPPPQGAGTLQPGRVEQSPDDLRSAVCQTMRSVLSRLGPADRVVGLALSSQGGTTIPIGADGCPTYNAISWMDQRGDLQAARARSAFGDDFIRATTGWPLQSLLPLQHIAWLRDNCPDTFAATRRFLFVNDFIGHWLTGQFAMDPTSAGITQLFSVSSGDWDDRLLAVAGIERVQLSPIVPCGHIIGHVTDQAAAATGLPAGTPVVNGAHDQYCAAVGAGVMQPGEVLLSCGTAWVLLAVPENPAAGLAGGMAVGRHAVDGRWGAIRSLGGVGASLEWLLDNVWCGCSEAALPRSEIYSAMNAAAATAAPAVAGMCFYPLAGGHAGNYGPARGGFAGLTLSHTRGDLARAVMEGIAFELRWVIEEMRLAGVHVSELTMVGGAASSPLWPQIVADVTNVVVTLPAFSEAAVRGAAILAGVGIGMFLDPAAGHARFRGPSDTRRWPQPAAVALYDTAFAAYRRGAEQ